MPVAHSSRDDRSAHAGASATPSARPAGPAPFDPWATFNAGCDVWWGSHADPTGIARRADWRLRELLEAACAAPLHARRLRAAAGPGVGDPARSREAARRVASLPLQAIEPISRVEAMRHFEDGVTDPEVTLDGVHAFLADPQRLGEAFLGRYAVWTSSGTTAAPGIWLHDARALAVYDALESLRFCGLDRPDAGARLLDDWLRAPFDAGRRFAMVGATGGHFAGNASVERMRRIWPWAAAHARTISIMQPLDALRAELEAFDPAVIATYPTAAELLAIEHEAGRLQVRPRELWLGGEHLGEAERSRIATAFGARVRQGYGASECLSIAWGCAYGALHLNTDWVVLEPVDRDGRPVPPGTPSHTVLLTNLANRVQPILRYDLGDSVTFRPGRCPCGSSFPAIGVDGRRDDALDLDGRDGPVRLLPLALVTVLEDDAQAFDFQLVARDASTLALRLPPQDPRRDACHRALRAYLDRQGLQRVDVVDDTIAPQRDAPSGKLRRVLRRPHP